MLIIKTFINAKQVDEVHVQNVGAFDKLFPHQPKPRPDLYVYKVREPKGFEEEIIVHTRKQGHRVLTSKVMDLIKHSRSGGQAWRK